MGGGPRTRRRGISCWLWVLGYEGMRSVRRATHAHGVATSVAGRSGETYGIPTGFRPPARGCGGTPLPREDSPTPPAQPQRGCVLQGRNRGNQSPARWLPPGHNPFGVDAIGGVTRPKVAPRTSGQPWAPGRNRVAVGRAAVRGRRSEVSRELRAEHGQKATCGRWAAQAHGVSPRRPTMPRTGISRVLSLPPRRGSYQSQGCRAAWDRSW